jgi:hypothetical protein
VFGRKLRDGELQYELDAGRLSARLLVFSSVGDWRVDGFVGETRVDETSDEVSRCVVSVAVYLVSVDDDTSLPDCVLPVNDLIRPNMKRSENDLDKPRWIVKTLAGDLSSHTDAILSVDESIFLRMKKYAETTSVSYTKSITRNTSQCACDTPVLAMVFSC